MIRTAILALMLLLLAGCAAVGPDYTGPGSTPADAVERFPSAPADSSAPPVAAWWQSLDDPELAALINETIGANFDLEIAAANLEAARARLAGVQTRRRPTIDLNGEVTEERGSSAGFILANPNDRFPTVSRGSFSLDLNWELDLFGRIRRSIEAATADLDALEAVRNDVTVAVLARVARAYVALRGQQILLDVAERNVGVQRQTIDLVTVLSREGAATQLDVARARTQLLTSEALIPALRADLTAALNTLTTLTARPPGALGERLGAHGGLPKLPESIAVGSPADLLRRRPDIRAAERRLAAAAARIGVATADLFPTISFVANIGAAGTPISNLDSVGAPFFELGPRLSWNLFDREAIHARIRAQDSQTATALANYRRTVTIALEEVDTALAAYTQQRLRQQNLEAAREASVQASSLARLRYREGSRRTADVCADPRTAPATGPEKARRSRCVRSS